ncbi:metallophosphoesterase family protein [Dongia sedimenti]|uniref:Metallophosphoesterase n=1 Tax=Dongia sedimenti TaxID=3064282 RepID=A0ABU0YK11_9PROT|nr:metallophosphoesterase [Rhodospirillaceae bacterium R-7]
MRVHVFSDLHLEFGPISLSPEVRSGRLADLVLLAGDIHTEHRGPRWAAETFEQPVAMILGNHEAYGGSLDPSIVAAWQEAAACSARRRHPIRAMERETWILQATDGTPVRIVAATLWTDFAIFGAARQADAMDHAHRAMNDFQMIGITDGGEQRLLAPADCLRLHRESQAYIADELARPFDGVTIVMTHHAPSRRSVPESRSLDPITAAYASDLEALIEQTQPQLWVHGHIHASSNYVIGSTRVVCNPRGYYPSQLNPAFDPALVVEVTR